MGNLIMNFLQEQGILIVMGLLVLEGLVHQWVASRRYRRLRTGLQALAASHGMTQERGQVPTSNGTVSMTAGRGGDKAAETTTEAAPSSRKKARRASRRQEVGRSAPEIVSGLEGQSRETASELDAQLLYLKQSLDRIAAGRDQKWEEEPREQRKLTPEQEAIIAEILREYLS